MKVKMAAVIFLLVGLLQSVIYSNASPINNKVGGASVHFYVANPTTIAGLANHMKYSDVILNIGGGYNSHTGVFTAPVSGVYQFFFSYQSSRGNENNSLCLFVRGKKVILSHSQVSRQSTASNLSTYMTQLNKGDTVYVRQESGRTWAEHWTRTTIFSGSLLN